MSDRNDKHDQELNELMAELKKLDDMPTKLQLGMDMLLTEKKLLLQEYEKNLEPIDAKLGKLNEHYLKLTGGHYEAALPPESAEAVRARVGLPKSPKAKPKVKAAKVAKPKGKRIRRSKEECVNEAKEIVAYVKAHNKNGVTGTEIKAKFTGVVGSIKDYVKKHAEVDLYSPKGIARPKMRYFVK